MCFWVSPPPTPSVYNVILIFLESHFFARSIDIFLLWKCERTESWQLWLIWWWKWSRWLVVWQILKGEYGEKNQYNQEIPLKRTSYALKAKLKLRFEEPQRWGPVSWIYRWKDDKYIHMGSSRSWGLGCWRGKGNRKKESLQMRIHMSYNRGHGGPSGAGIILTNSFSVRLVPRKWRVQ